MTTVHLLTKNNGSTIRKAFESLIGLQPRFLVGDYGSSDETVQICKQFGAEVVLVKGMARHEARNYLSSISSDSLNFMIEPWEFVLQGYKALSRLDGSQGYVRVIQNNVATWEARLWQGRQQFINPVFERLDVESGVHLPVVLTSTGGFESKEALDLVGKWKSDEPLLKQPHYYHACLLFSQKRYDDFLKTAEHYLFLDKSQSMSATMTRYYYAMTQLVYKGKVKPTLQNLNICLCAKPTMAEFWCLTGDVYYHLLNKFDLAKEFYENAIILGSRRLNSDKWPMDIAKYSKYPKMMIESCDKIIGNQTGFMPIKNAP